MRIEDPKPAHERARPIFDGGKSRPPSSRGEKTKRTKRTSNAVLMKQRKKPLIVRTRIRGMRKRDFMDRGGEDKKDDGVGVGVGVGV